MNVYHIKWVCVTSFRIFFLVPSICVQISQCHYFKQIKQYSVVSMYHVFFVHFSVVGHIGCLQMLHIIHRTGLNMADQVSLWEDEASFEYKAKSEESRPHVH